jgi:hypothetical protein
MAITSSMRCDNGAMSFASGSFIDTGTILATAISLGFVPRYVRLENVTDRDGWEWFEGAAAGTTLKTVAAGTRTLDTSDVAISVGTLSMTTAGVYQVYTPTTSTVGVPGTDPVDATDSSHLNVANEKVVGCWFPQAVLEASKQYRWQAWG